jgi:preprotein translocase subunit SecE
MARIRPSKGQESGEPGPGGAEPPVPGKKKKDSGDKPKAQPRPRRQPKTEKTGSVTKAVQEGRSRRFFGETITELKKVTWPNRAQLFQATAVVIIFVAVVAIYLGVIDALMSALVDAIF